MQINTHTIEIEPGVTLSTQLPPASGGMPVLLIDGKAYSAADSLKHTRLAKNCTALEYVRQQADIMGSFALRDLAKYFAC
jgi:hypothetical protein